MLFVVYGTLRTGEHFHDVFGEFGEITESVEIELKGFKMFDLGAFPAAFKTCNDHDKMVVEVLTFEPYNGSEYNTKNCIKVLDNIEGVDRGLYIKEYIQINGFKEKALIYIMSDNELIKQFERAKYPIIIDWKDRF